MHGNYQRCERDIYLKDLRQLRRGLRFAALIIRRRPAGTKWDKTSPQIRDRNKLWGTLP